jgi:hypothetical protein
MLGLFIRDIEYPGSFRRLWNQIAAMTATHRGSELSYTRGFSQAESEGRWTDGHVAALEQPVEYPIGEVVEARLTVRPFIPAGHGEFRFSVDAGLGVEQHRLTDPKATTIRLMARVAGIGSPKVVVVFDLHDARSPKALDLADDPRLLGLFFLNVEVGAGIAATGALASNDNSP